MSTLNLVLMDDQGHHITTLLNETAIPPQGLVYNFGKGRIRSRYQVAEVQRVIDLTSNNIPDQIKASDNMYRVDVVPVH